MTGPPDDSTLSATPSSAPRSPPPDPHAASAWRPAAATGFGNLHRQPGAQDLHELPEVRGAPFPARSLALLQDLLDGPARRGQVGHRDQFWQEKWIAVAWARGGPTNNRRSPSLSAR